MIEILEKDSLCSFFFDLLKKISKEAISKRGYFSLALSGGKTPIPFFKLIVERKRELDLKNFYIFFADERMVPADSIENNGFLVEKYLIGPAEIENVFYIKSEGEVEDSAADYQKRLEEFFKRDPRFDLIILGIGEDGHTASLFPGGGEVDSRDRLIVCSKRGNIFRVSFSLSLINMARNIIFLVTGKSKREIIKRIFIDRDRSLPAAKVKPEGNLYYLLDKEAGALF